MAGDIVAQRAVVAAHDKLARKWRFSDVGDGAARASRAAVAIYIYIYISRRGMRDMCASMQIRQALSTYRLRALRFFVAIDRAVYIARQ